MGGNLISIPWYVDLHIFTTGETGPCIGYFLRSLLLSASYRDLASIAYSKGPNTDLSSQSFQDGREYSKTNEFHEYGLTDAILLLWSEFL